MSALINELSMLVCISFFTSSPTLIISNFARYREIPLAVKAIIIARGIKKISVWFFSIKIFSIAGSKSQAIDDVLPATIIEKKAAKKMLIRCLLV